MGLYRHRIFPWLMDFSMASGEVESLRRELLADVRGEVLEIGSGTGLNFPHYPAQAGPVTGVDPNPGMARRAGRRRDRAPVEVRLEIADAQDLPFDAGRFDAAVTTFTLCSIPRVERALAEVRRVLRPGGRLHYMEHGLAPEPRVRRWQRRLTPLQRVVADGCHLDRNIRALLEAAGFDPGGETFYLHRVPKVLGHLYRGVSLRP